ncbi:MAG: SCP2 sterol-binding domain-containing protein [Pseudomonadota bacterium]
MTPEVAELARLGVEKALNAALASDPEALQGLRSLNGQRIRIDIKGLFAFDLLPQANALSATLVVADAALDVAPDAILRASPLGFLRARMRGDLMHDDLELTGDSHVSLRAAQLLSQLQPDLEQALTPKFGLIPAHQIASLWQEMRHEIRRMLERHAQNKADFLHDEIEVSPRRIETEAWMDAVDGLRSRADALDRRIRRLEDKR